MSHSSLSCIELYYEIQLFGTVDVPGIGSFVIYNPTMKKSGLKSL